MKHKAEDIDADYAGKRNKLIPDAEKYADKKCGPRPSYSPKGGNKALDDWNSAWNLTFHTKMNQLWEQKKGGKGGRSTMA